MNTCFAFGIKGRPPAAKTASGIRGIEYLNYNVRGEATDHIRVLGDFFFPNTESQEREYFFLHAGDVAFELPDDRELSEEGNFFLSFLAKLYAPSLGCRLDKAGRLIGLCDAGMAVTDIRKPAEYRRTLHRLDLPGNNWAPFSLYGVVVPPRTLGFVRVVGTVQDRTLATLTKNGESFDIYGGEILVDKIRSDYVPLWPGSENEPRNKYAELLEDFLGESYVEPARYDMVLWSSPGTRPVKSRERTPDLSVGCKTRNFGDRLIDWYWSCSALFYVDGWQNGLHVNVDLAALPPEGVRPSALLEGSAHS